MLSVLLAHELRDTAISVNSADPEFTVTDLNGHQGNQTVEQGARDGRLHEYRRPEPVVIRKWSEWKPSCRGTTEPFAWRGVLHICRALAS